MTEPIGPGNDGIPQHAATEDPETISGVDVPPDESPPVEATLQPRPEPVLDAAKLGGLVAACVVTVGGVIGLIAAGRYGDLSALGTAIGGAVTAVAALSAYLAPVLQARKARTKVTPLADPRDYRGRRMIAIPPPQPKDR